MTWNKDNPRFRRSSLLGPRRKKQSFMSRLNGLFKSGPGGTARPARPHQPAPPQEPLDDLKLVVPKPKKNQTRDESHPGGDNALTVEEVGRVAESGSIKPPPPENIPERPPLAGEAGEARKLKATPPRRPDMSSGEEPAGGLKPGPGEEGRPEDEYKINQLGRPRRKKTRSQRDDFTEAGLGCDPSKAPTPDDSVCRPPRKNLENDSPSAPPRRREAEPQKPWREKTFRDGPFSPFPGPDRAAAENGTPETPARLAERKIRERRLIRLALVSFVLVAVVIAAAAYLLLSPKTERPVAKVTRLPQASLPKVAPISAGFFEFYAMELESAVKTEVTIQSGGSLGQALEAVGLGGRQGSGALVSYMTKDDIVPVVQPGDILRAFWADRGKNELARLEYVPSSSRTRADLTPLVIMRRADGGFWHYRPAPPLLTLSAAKEAIIDGSLWAAGSKAGLDAGIITSITEILASDIDFMTDIKKGDTFKVLYSRDYRDGRPRGEPIIDMITLVSGGRNYEYYRYVGEGDQVSYYDHEGRSSRKAFFMTPLQYKRISSQFTMNRLHPIHKVRRPHQGVDYAAPSGTPVSTVADGTVVFCGWNGGYGKLVTIKHNDTYTTMYAHLSKFAPGLAKGSTVKQGDLIGYVGATGTATGPHLDFRLKKHGNFIDPLPVLSEQKGQEMEPATKQEYIEKVLTPLRDEMTKKLMASRDNF